MPDLRSLMPFVVLPATLLGCGGGEPSSSGIAHWQVSDEPVVRIGVVDGEPHYQFHQVQDVRRLEDGRLVVANAGTQEIRIFDSGGRYASTSGRVGSGPGEFRSLASVDVLPGDSLLAFDAGNLRVTVLDPAGSYTRSWIVENPSRGVFPAKARALSDGTVLVTYFRGRMPGDPPGVFRQSAPVVRYSSEGEILNTLGELPGDEWYYSEAYRTLSDRAFGRKGHLVTHGDLVFIGGAETPEVRVYSPEGEVVRTISGTAPRPVTPSDVDAYRDARLQRATDPDNRRDLEGLLADMSYPETMPAYSALYVDSDGRLWMEEFSFPTGRTSRWSIFDPEGQLAARVEMPAGFRPMFSAGGGIGGVMTDELGVEYVVVYALSR